MGCGASRGLSPPDEDELAVRPEVEIPEYDDEPEPEPEPEPPEPIEHTLFGSDGKGRCDCGPVHRRDAMSARFGNPYLAQGSATIETTDFRPLDLPRLSQPLVSQLIGNYNPMPGSRDVVSGNFLMPAAHISSPAKNYLDAPFSPTRLQPTLMLGAPVPRKTTDQLRDDAASTWMDKRRR